MNRTEIGMMILALIILVFMTGCASVVPVTMHFPQAPETLTKPCEELETLPADKKELSDLLDNASGNYGKHYECAEKIKSWNDWYNTQKKIHEEVK